MNNQNNSYQIDKVNLPTKAIVFIGSYSCHNPMTVNENLNNFCHKQGWNKVEIIEAQNHYDKEALNKLIASVRHHDSTFTPPTLLIDGNVLLMSYNPILSAILHTISIMKPVKIKVFVYEELVECGVMISLEDILQQIDADNLLHSAFRNFFLSHVNK